MDRIEQLTPALAGRYEIEREIGHGGMATVYLARDARHDRNVALKVLDPELAAALGADRFLAEIKTTANLQHPHVVALHDSGAVDGFLFYVMPFVEGESLRQRLDRERMLPVADAIRIAREVADALEYAHGQGIVHRDVKPENILIQRGHAMVADFGIALAVQQAGNARMTQTGLSLGTPQYMSPEQAMGERTVDARSDVYALAAITYEMLTGEPPFTGATMQAVVARILAEDPRPISTQRKAVPPSVEAAVLKALEKVPADRFGSAREFSDALVADAPANIAPGDGEPRLALARDRRRGTCTLRDSPRAPRPATSRAASQFRDDDVDDRRPAGGAVRSEQLRAFSRRRQPGIREQRGRRRRTNLDSSHERRERARTRRNGGRARTFLGAGRLGNRILRAGITPHDRDRHRLGAHSRACAQPVTRRGVESNGHDRVLAVLRRPVDRRRERWDAEASRQRRQERTGAVLPARRSSISVLGRRATMESLLRRSSAMWRRARFAASPMAFLIRDTSRLDISCSFRSPIAPSASNPRRCSRNRSTSAALSSPVNRFP